MCTAILLIAPIARAAEPNAAPPDGARAAEARRQADTLVSEGLGFLRERLYQEAWNTFSRAHDLLPSPAIEVRLGFAAQGLARWIDAEIYLDGGLQVVRDPWIKQNRAVIERSLADVRGHLGWLTVRGMPNDAVVKIDGITRGLLPKAGPVRVIVGDRKLEVRADGHAPDQRAVAVEAGRRVEVEVKLAPLVSAPARAVDTRAAAGSGASSPGFVATAQTGSAPPVKGVPDAEALAAEEATGVRDRAPRASISAHRVAWWGAAVAAPIGVAGLVWHALASDHRDPIEGDELAALIMMAAGGAVTATSLSFLAVELVMAPASGGGAQVAVAGRF